MIQKPKRSRSKRGRARRAKPREAPPEIIEMYRQKCRMQRALEKMFEGVEPYKFADYE